MRRRKFYIGLIFYLIWPYIANSQIDSIRNIQPVLKIVSVDPATGFVEMYWNQIPSAYVAGFELFHFDLRFQGAMRFKTLWDPSLLDYVDSSQFANYYSVEYQIQAIDSQANQSKLSNRISTIFVTSAIDTCNKKIQLNWNSYSSQPLRVINYSVLGSVNGSGFTEIGTAGASENSFSYSDFSYNSTYCFIVKANLEGGLFSASNKTCLSTKMQRYPEWINADQASVNDDNSISLSYTIDPFSEIKTFGLDRKKDSDPDFARLTVLQSSASKVLYTDHSATPGQRYIYRLAAINNCGNPVVLSPVSVNMVLMLTVTEGNIELSWNKYREWAGSVDHYKVFMNTGGGFTEKTQLQPGDSTYSIPYSGIMYEVESGTYCFRIEAYEGTNPHGITGLSRSGLACGETKEIITVPNAFTPDNDNINERFRPVLSFTPVEYRLIITDRKNSRVFDTSSHLAEWDGTSSGRSVSEDVYLWYLKVKTPSGKYISRNGTVTIIRN